MEVLCRCCGKGISVPTERRRVGSAKEVPFTLSRLVGNRSSAESLRGGCVCRHRVSRLQRLSKLQADAKALQDELQSSLRAVYGSADVPALGKHSLEAALDSGATGNLVTMNCVDPA